MGALSRFSQTNVWNAWKFSWRWIVLKRPLTLLSRRSQSNGNQFIDLQSKSMAGLYMIGTSVKKELNINFDEGTFFLILFNLLNLLTPWLKKKNIWNCTTNLTVLKLSYFGLPYLSLLRKSWWTNWTLNDNSSKHFKLFSTTCLFYFKSMKLLLVYNLINLTFISSSFEHIQEQVLKQKMSTKNIPPNLY